MINVEQLEVIYPGAVAPSLGPLDLAVQSGAITVLLGASGAGKSTLLRSFNGLVRPTTGRVITQDFGDICNARTLLRHRRRTGMIFQQHHLIGKLTVLGNVLLGRLPHHAPFASLLPFPQRDKRLALDALDRVHMLDFALRRADQLSGGQQQRVGIARALVQQPQILLADEPVASLDPVTASQVLELLRTICKADNLTTVVSLHQLDLARRFADRIVGIAAGRIVFDGSPELLTADVERRIYRDGGRRPESHGEHGSTYHELMELKHEPSEIPAKCRLSHGSIRASRPGPDRAEAVAPRAPAR